MRHVLGGLVGAWFLGSTMALSMVACGGAPEPVTAAPPATTPAAGATAPAGSGAPAEPAAEPPPPPVAAPMEEAEAAKELERDEKLKDLARISPRTHKSLLKGYLWKAVGECPADKMVEVAAAPGVLVTKPARLRAEARKGLEGAGALAQQRGMALEVAGGGPTVKEAVTEWNTAILGKALELAKAAPPADQKEKTFAAEARKALGGEGPRGWGEHPCESQALGGWAVTVQLVTIDGIGKRGQVLVKAGPESHFSQQAYEAAYWDKKKGKNFRTLTEIMSAGKFVRRCSDATLFVTSPTSDGGWRCKEDPNSWDPPNRPIPAWQ
ncbi:MAG: hypothetical protein WKG00_15895 [Polyangiaceae bacterium]